MAAIEAQQVQVVEELLAENVDPASNTRCFGEIFAAAASSGFLDMVMTVLKHWNWNADKPLLRVRYIPSVEAAAIAGHQDIVIKLLDFGRSLPKPLYDATIFRVVDADHIAVLHLLLSHRQQHFNLDAEKAFWATLIRSSIQYSNRELLQHIMSKNLSIIEEATIAQAVEDGCRMSHDDIVRTLLSRLARLPDRDPALYADALFWAAESGRSEILADVLNLFQQGQRQIIRALAGAVSGNGFSSITYLLESVGVVTIDQVAPKRFTDAVRMIIPEAFARALGGCAEPLSRLVENALQASRSGGLGKVIGSFELAKAQYSGYNLRGFSGAFSEAAKSGHSDILLYLCENREPHLVFPCVTCPAIAHIFMNFGWDVNQPDVGSKCGRLGYVYNSLNH